MGGRIRKDADLAWREQAVEKRLVHALLHGITSHITKDKEAARLGTRHAIQIIDGSLIGWHEYRGRSVCCGENVFAAGCEGGTCDEIGRCAPYSFY